ncbi:DNA primase [Candidatus Dojkabacteria bacterium]|jgi:DNA primase catalytic core|nr:DNA primase [Candidatus Dojkabacteria bacterium]HRY74457.1 DNA primase [Candidatus Dojkabacteria bacterium]HRZ84520.1 DNA primase [Candidatus Dojkabacteria bacterium]
MQEGNQIEEIKERIDIVQLIEKYVKLKQTGKNFSGLCPFHKEKTPSFIVSPDIQRYKCFGCGRSGDIFNFVQDIENIDFVEALEKLAKTAGVELKKSSPNTKFKEIKEVNYIATKYYYNQLLKSPIALSYVLKRGINKEYIKKFALGYAPKYPKLISEIKKSGNYSKKVLLESGLFIEKNGILKEKFFDRIMFPIRSKRGDVIAFTARQNAGNEYGPKYMNSPETPIFHKSYNLFGQYESRQEIRKQDLVIICEGSTDVISAHQVGIKNIVAPLGTSLTSQQLESLIPLTKNILLFFDSDSAGKAAIVRGFELASKLEMNPFAASPSPYKDIDELIQNEPSKISEVISNKVEAFSFILADTIKDRDLNKLEDVDKIKKTILPILNFVKDINTKSLYIKKLEEITGITYGNTKGEEKNMKLSSPTKNQINPLIESTETRYLQLLLFAENRKEEYFLDEKYISDKVQQEIFSFITLNKTLTKSELFEKINTNTEAQKVLEDMIFNANKLPQESELENELFYLQRLLKVKYYKQIQKNLVSKIAMSDEIEDEEEKSKALKQLQKVAKILQKLKNE